jgi:hypothetical protein
MKWADMLMCLFLGFSLGRLATVELEKLGTPWLSKGLVAWTNVVKL